ncbi:glycosyltransferase family 2 protein [Candidatus Uhrbacteria bacterium]|nr:glycosyltransferase family 2 protein [Candidatus Uhrbacteria bacterium]
MGHHAPQTSVDHAPSQVVATGHASALPLVSIVIVNYNTKGLLKYCLRGIAVAKLSFVYEVLVVDNASSDGSSDMVRRLFPDVRLFPEATNRGFAHGNNIGIAHAHGRYVLIMNPDIVVRSGALETLADFLERHPHVAVAGPRLTNPDGSLQYSCFHFPDLFIPFYRRTLFGRLPFARRAIAQYCMTSANHAKAQTVDWLLGATIMIRKSAIDAVGLMDERFFLYFEDVDWCRRFWKEGHEVWYVPEASLTHFHQRESAEVTGIATMFSKAARAHIVSYVKYFWKWRK